MEEEQPIVEQFEQEQESEESDEDENGELINDGVQSKFLSILAKIRTKDPEIYKVKNSIFQEEDFDTAQAVKSPQTKEKKLTYKDMERQRIIGNAQNGNKLTVEEEEQPEPTPYELQQRLKSEFKNVAKQADQGDAQCDDFFKVKPKKHVQAEEPHQVLKKLAKDEHEHQILQKFWGDDSKLDETDLFLKRYILSKGWVDVNDEASKKKAGKKILKEDDERSEEMEEFEDRYNFRFEEPGGTSLQTFPRHIEESARLKKETRKEKRTRKEQQKKKQLQEELRKAQKKKAEKKKQIKMRIAQLQQEKGLNNIDVQPEQQEGPPATWFYCDDCQRGLAEQEAYYVCQECPDYTLCSECNDLIIHKHKLAEQVVPDGCGAPDPEEVRRTLSELLRCRKCKTMLDEYSKRYELVDPNDGFTYNYCEECQDLLPLSLRRKCKLHKAEKVKLDEILANEPDKLKDYVEDDEVDRLLKDYLGLDYDRIIGGNTRTKFKYIDVKPESYGLSDEQLLYSDDKELNKYVSIKKLAPYREENLRLRNSIYNKKIKGISRSAKLNRKRVQADEAGDPSKLAKRKLQLLRERVQRRKQNSAEKVKRIRLLNLSTQELEVKHFLPKSRLESYGLE